MNDLGAPFDVPWPVWAGLAFLLAVAFGAGLAAPRRALSGRRGFLVRWGHAGVWVFMAGMFATRAFGPALEPVSSALGLLALGTYASFLLALFGSTGRTLAGRGKSSNPRLTSP